MNTRNRGQPAGLRPWETRRAEINKTPPPAVTLAATKAKKIVKPNPVPPAVTKAKVVKPKAAAVKAPRTRAKIATAQQPLSQPTRPASEAQAATRLIDSNIQSSAPDSPSLPSPNAQTTTQLPQRSVPGPPVRPRPRPRPIPKAQATTRPVQKSMLDVPRPMSSSPAPSALSRPIAEETTGSSPLRRPPPYIARTILHGHDNEGNARARSITPPPQLHSAYGDQAPEVPPTGVQLDDFLAAMNGVVDGAIPNVATPDRPTVASPLRIRTYGRQAGDRSPRRYLGDLPSTSRRNSTAPGVPAPRRSFPHLPTAATSSPALANESLESDSEEPFAPFPQLHGGRISTKNLEAVDAAKDAFVKVLIALAKELGVKVSTLLMHCNFASLMSTSKRPTAWNVFQSELSAGVLRNHGCENANTDATNEDTELSALPQSTRELYESLQAQHGGKDSDEWKTYSNTLTSNYQAKKIASENSMISIGSNEAKIMNATKRAWDAQMQWLANMGIHCAYFMITSNPRTSTAHKENCISIATPELMEWFDNKLKSNTSLTATSDIYHYLLSGSYPETVIADRIQVFLEKRDKELKNRDETRKACVKTIKMLFAPFHPLDRVEWAAMGTILQKFQIRMYNRPLVSDFPMLGSCTGDGYDTKQIKVLYEALGAENPVDAYAAEDQSDLIQVSGWSSEEQVLKGKAFDNVVLMTDIEGNVLMRVKDTVGTPYASSQSAGSKRKRATDQASSFLGQKHKSNSFVRDSAHPTSSSPSAPLSSFLSLPTSPLPTLHSSPPLHSSSSMSHARPANGPVAKVYTDGELLAAAAWLQSGNRAPEHVPQQQFPTPSNSQVFSDNSLGPFNFGHLDNSGVNAASGGEGGLFGGMPFL